MSAREAPSRARPGMRKGSRLLWLDVSRGVAILAMAVYHLTWDLAYFRYAPEAFLRHPGFVVFGHTVAVSFLAVSGFALALASRNGIDWAKYLRWLAKLIAAAALVTIATFFAFPDSFVTFGILHCIAAASVIAVLFARLPWWTAATGGAAIVAAGFSIAVPGFDPVNGWLGLGERIPFTNDWRPLFPWGGFVLLGLAAGKLFQRTAPKPSEGTSPAAPARLLALAGRHSLLIYLVHQPLLFGFVWLAALVFPPRTAGAQIPDTPFQSNCFSRCTQAGSAAAWCSRACGCVVAGAKAANIWTGVATGRLTAGDQIRYDEVIAVCRKKASQP